MKIQVVQLPRLIEPAQLVDRVVVVFDVLRATSSITAALAAGVNDIRIFGSAAEAELAAGAFQGKKFLCGEKNCLPPPGFDLGNSPGDFSLTLHAGATIFMSTTNGTRAIVAARSAPVVLIGCLLNAFAVAKKLASLGRDVTLLCSGTDGEPSEDDEIGAGAVIASLTKLVPCTVDGEAALRAHDLYKNAANDLAAALTATQSGQNVLRAGLQKDITFSARVDVFSIVGEVRDEPLRVVASA